jgi:hypothetical protein
MRALTQASAGRRAARMDSPCMRFAAGESPAVSPPSTTRS